MLQIKGLSAAGVVGKADRSLPIKFPGTHLADPGTVMDIKTMPSNIVYLKNYSNTDSLDELLADEKFITELIELINQNFVLEVKACHAQEE